MKLAEIAARIDAHLKRFEADKAVNRPSKGGEPPYRFANAWASGSRVGIRYLSYQPSDDFLTKADALAYLARLDNGFVGKHWSA